jgi:hypothetical protein
MTWSVCSFVIMLDTRGWSYPPAPVGAQGIQVHIVGAQLLRCRPHMARQNLKHPKQTLKTEPTSGTKSASQFEVRRDSVPKFNEYCNSDDRSCEAHV